MGTPTNRTPVRVARGSTTALNTGLSDIQEGEIVWDTTLNKLQVKEGSALENHTVAADATKANLSGATFTGGVNLADDVKLTLGNGAGDDYNPGSYEIYEDTDLYIKSRGGHMRHQAAAGVGVLLEGPTGSIAKFIEGGACELYHDDVMRLSTTSLAVDITGILTVSAGASFGPTSALQIDVPSDGTASGYNTIFTNNSSGDFYLRGEELYIQDSGNSNAEWIHCVDGAGVELTHAGTKKFETTSSGVTVTGAAVPASITALSSSSNSTAVDLSANNNFSLTLAENSTIAQPSNQTVGQSGSIFITQDGTGSRTLAYHADWKWAGATAPTLSTAAASVDRIDYIVAAANKIHAVVTLAVA